MNGVLITGLRVVPFIITLGTMLLVRGGAKGLAEERRLEAPFTWLNGMLRTVRDGSGLLLPWGIWVVILLAVAVAITLQFTRFGRHIFAIGSNERTARLCGVRVERCKIAVYTIAGALAGLAGVMEFSRLSVGDPTVAIGAELGVIAAVIIGGGSLSGYSDRLFAARAAELGAGNRDRHDHRVCGRARSFTAISQSANLPFFQCRSLISQSWISGFRRQKIRSVRMRFIRILTTRPRT
jgi:ribose/xylose/arabinose/galactoside ABC-type transport system permease subunit